MSSLEFDPPSPGLYHGLVNVLCVQVLHRSNHEQKGISFSAIDLFFIVFKQFLVRTLYQRFYFQVGDCKESSLISGQFKINVQGERSTNKILISIWNCVAFF